MSREQGLTKLARALETLGLSQAEVLPSFEVIPEVDALFSGEGDIFYSEDEQRDLREFLQNKAMRILEPRLHRDKNPWTEQKRSERLLGYGNTSQLLVFYYNVPTVTLTPLWLGEESERGWKPLFARRGKPST